VTVDSEPGRVARATLSCVAEPGDPVMGALLRDCSPAAIVASLMAGRSPVAAGPPRSGCGAAGRGGDGGGERIPGLDRALQRWGARLGEAPDAAALAGWQQQGIRLLCPGDPEWPGQLDVLGDAQPWALWVRGNADLRYACLRSVSLVGSRAATAYGIHVASEMAAVLAEHGWAVVSGGAFGVDGWAHRGALAAEGVTIAVLPSGVDDPYPPAHRELFHAIAAHGAVVSEWPPGRRPTRHGFLVRNRVIAALTRGTVVVEAALRSGALNTARHARDQGRPLMAVPGPVTSAQSAGCHELIREWNAACVTSARDVIELLSLPGDEVPAGQRPPVLPRDALDPVTARVLEAVPAGPGRGPARIAVLAGVDFDTALRCLGALADGGHGKSVSGPDLANSCPIPGRNLAFRKNTCACWLCASRRKPLRGPGRAPHPEQPAQRGRGVAGRRGRTRILR
jgi:DNA processing protein